MSGPNNSSSHPLVSPLGRLLCLAGLCLSLGGAAVLGAGLEEQVRRTDAMLQRLSVSEPVKPRAAAAPTTATSAAATSSTTATVKALATAPLLKARVTTATVVLRRTRPALAPTSGTRVVAQSAPHLSGKLTSATAALTTGALAALPGVPALDPTWLKKPQPDVNAQPALAADPAASAPPAVPTAGRPVRVNHADAQELRAALKLDPTRARYIIQFRTVHGRFKEPDDLAQVSGINEEMVKQWDERNLLIFD